MYNAYILYNINIIKGQKHCFEMLLPFIIFLFCQFNFYSDIADAGKDFSLHVVAYGDMDESPWFILYILMGKLY